jgi:molybdopterin-biosynthesis enzyme MoeA-like protein
MEYHQSTLDRMHAFYSQKVPAVELTLARKRMALFPVIQSPRSKVLFYDRKLNHTTPLWVPLVVVENVHILPGVPILFQALVDGFFDDTPGSLVHNLRTVHQQRPMVRRLMGANVPEGDFAEALASVQTQFSGRVDIGSYPKTQSLSKGSKDIRVVISFEGEKESDVAACAELAGELISLVHLDEDDIAKPTPAKL